MANTCYNVITVDSTVSIREIFPGYQYDPNKLCHYFNFEDLWPTLVKFNLTEGHQCWEDYVAFSEVVHPIAFEFEDSERFVCDFEYESKWVPQEKFICALFSCIKHCDKDAKLEHYHFEPNEELSGYYDNDLGEIAWDEGWGNVVYLNTIDKYAVSEWLVIPKSWRECYWADQFLTLKEAVKELAAADSDTELERDITFLYDICSRKYR